MEETINNIGLDYNTEREKLEMPEYGRNLLKMVEKKQNFIKTIILLSKKYVYKTE